MSEWVADNDRLLQLVQQWQQQEAIALDTEFMRSRTFFPQIGLLQVADSEGVYLIDPLAITELQPLRDIMAASDVVKIVHSCSEDLDVFQCYLGTLPTPLFDTQLAAGFAGYGASLGYSALVEQLQGKAIAKQETRSDWLQRPLSESQLQYAAQDVEYLLDIYQQLREQLTQLQRLSWVESDCQKIIDNATPKTDFSDSYLRIKTAWKLKPHQLAVLRELCAWREELARDNDKPRNHVVKDVALWSTAQRLPKNLKGLRAIPDMSPRFIQDHGEQCLDILQTALDDKERYPLALPAPFNTEETRVFKSLKAQVQSMAESLKLPAELLARKKELETLVRQKQTASVTLPANLQGWRRDVIGEVLINHLKSL